MYCRLIESTQRRRRDQSIPYRCITGVQSMPPCLARHTCPCRESEEPGPHVCSIGLVYRSMTVNNGRRGAPTILSVATRVLSYFDSRWSVSYALT